MIFAVYNNDESTLWPILRIPMVKSNLICHLISVSLDGINSHVDIRSAASDVNVKMLSVSASNSVGWTQWRTDRWGSWIAQFVTITTEYMRQDFLSSYREYNKIDMKIALLIQSWLTRLETTLSHKSQCHNIHDTKQGPLVLYGSCIWIWFDELYLSLDWLYLLFIISFIRHFNIKNI